MNHFLDVRYHSRLVLDHLLERAILFKNTRCYPVYSNHTLANLFYENSTRTRVSFELAAQRLSIPVINLNLTYSSESKGEVIDDTIKNLAAMGIDLMVVRHQQAGLPEHLATHINRAHIINAGDGTNAHPTQAMLDLMTIVEEKSCLSQLKIAIIGNVRHSRVANSLQWLFAIIGVGELVFIAPDIWQPKLIHFGKVTTSMREGLNQADVIICLRVQQERLAADEQIDWYEYRRDFALTPTTLAYAKPDAMVMHPGPVNWGTEIDLTFANSEQSFILKQVTNGVFMRMAIIEWLLGHN